MEYCATGRRATQRGVALITALLVIALVTAAAVAMASRQQLDIRRTANTLQRDQAYVYAQGAEVMARVVLAKDDPTTDHKEEDWGKSGVTIPFQGGLLTGTLEDIQGRFNLNNVVTNGLVNPHDVERLTRLLLILQAKNQDKEDWKNSQPSELASAVVDWIDPDNAVSQPGGAEDSDYLQKERPYRAANAPMTSTSELLLVRGFTSVIYRDLAPYVTALAEHTLINVNTARFDVLRTLDKNDKCIDVTKLGREDVQSSLTADTDADKVKPKPFPDVPNFIASVGCTFDDFVPPNAKPLAAGAPPSPQEDPAKVLSINTSYFQVNAYAEVGPEDHRVKVKLYSVLQRKAGKIATLSRAQGFE